MILVQLGGGQSDIIDGIQYIFDYAASENKPAVINMSLGTHIGPHDGTSRQDQAFDALSGPGRILVGAAGTRVILHYIPLTYLKTTQSRPSFILRNEIPNYGYGHIDIWGEPNSEITAAVNVFDSDGFYIAYTRITIQQGVIFWIQCSLLVVIQ